MILFRHEVIFRLAEHEDLLASKSPHAGVTLAVPGGLLRIGLCCLILIINLIGID